MRTKSIKKNKINVVTLGCSKNIYDSEVLMGQLKANGKDVFKGEFGPAVSKDPFLNFKYKGAKGDKITVSWVDNKGGKRTDEATAS